jgi:hypothetical protein
MIERPGTVQANHHNMSILQPQQTTSSNDGLGRNHLTGILRTSLQRYSRLGVNDTNPVEPSSASRSRKSAHLKYENYRNSAPSVEAPKSQSSG